jgi:uncharacterized OsmC-like protein
MGVPVDRIEVAIEGDLDLQGTLGVSKDVPVGFGDIRMYYEIDAPQASSEQLRALQTKTEQYCVVLQTLKVPPPIQIEWEHGPSLNK